MLKQTAFSDKVSLVAIFFPFRKETDTGNLWKIIHFLNASITSLNLVISVLHPLIY
jgi:hypothetical protein